MWLSLRLWIKAWFDLGLFAQDGAKNTAPLVSTHWSSTIPPTSRKEKSQSKFSWTFTFSWKNSSIMSLKVWEMLISYGNYWQNRQYFKENSKYLKIWQNAFKPFWFLTFLKNLSFFLMRDFYFCFSSMEILKGKCTSGILRWPMRKFSSL